MTTEKLFYQDPYIKSFSAQILQSRKDEQGRYYVVLDQTAFYPTGGGQPHDTGTINDVQVYDVEEVEGEVRHFVDTPIEEKECVGEIDLGRRFDHMQQHAGQHILTAAFEEMYGYKTVSFHLGKEICAIDLEIPALQEEEANNVEDRVNAIILENRPIEARWVTANEIDNFPLRKDLSVKENIRLVIIPDFDYNGCGGTHPNSTGQVSSVKILHWEKQKNSIRVHFICGNRVLKQLHEKHQVIQRLNALLSAPQEDLEAATNHVKEQQKSLEKTVSELKTELMEEEAHGLIDQATTMENDRLVKKVYKERPMNELQQLAKHITKKADSIMVLLVSEKDDKLQVVCARSQDIDMNMKELIASVLPKINGRGGGNAMIAQGGGDNILSPEAFIEEMMSKLVHGQSC
ncbi:DHHA1 domain-containing protein [Aquibacillus sp. 3ASR75-11]|uniref:Alanine--tRNA ligase n=1 Tax=Terrihalobacillus insolitus TaxID=2950438 RepID=A0A9X3WWA3_9BACI|nr:DHHA1 domain-containing protein [Terrihalobacillus insolitus]MDC3424589.1 DHHA1 domain-containing protein [Terrihalobacillus insolitus]